jgi:hypothetical protein
MGNNVETRVAGWFDCKGGPWYPGLSHGGYVAYRIWQQFDGLRWFQRHEWKRSDGTLEIEKWIAGVSGFLPSSQQSADA